MKRIVNLLIILSFISCTLSAQESVRLLMLVDRRAKESAIRTGFSCIASRRLEECSRKFPSGI